MNRPCSGLNHNGGCERRQECANYRHWLDDPRSEFNVCAALGGNFAHFVPVSIPASIAASGPQGSLFQ